MSTLGDDQVELWSSSSRPSLESSRIFVGPNFALPDIPSCSAHLVLNAFSFSEMAHPTLVEYFTQINRVGERYLLSANMDRAGVLNRGFERTPSSRFPIDPSVWKRLYKKPDLFQGPTGDYREELFEKRKDQRET